MTLLPGSSSIHDCGSTGVGVHALNGRARAECLPGCLHIERCPATAHLMSELWDTAASTGPRVMCMLLVLHRTSCTSSAHHPVSTPAPHTQCACSFGSSTAHQHGGAGQNPVASAEAQSLFGNWQPLHLLPATAPNICTPATLSDP